MVRAKCGQAAVGILGAAFLVAAVSARPDTVIYDNITGNPTQLALFMADEGADDTILVAGGEVRRVEVAIRKSFGVDIYDGVMQVRLYADAEGLPGALLGSSSVPLFLTHNDGMVVAAPFDGVTVPSGLIWTSVQFSLMNGVVGAGFLDGGHPSIGSSTGWRARNDGGGWEPYYLHEADYLYRITTVPGAGGVAVVGIGIGLAGLRRRK